MQSARQMARSQGGIWPWNGPFLGRCEKRPIDTLAGQILLSPCRQPVPAGTGQPLPNRTTLDAETLQPRPAAPPAAAGTPTATLQASEGLQRWLRQHCESTGLVVSAVVVPAEPMGAVPLPESQAVPVAQWPPEWVPTNAHLLAARAAMQRVRPVDIALSLAAPGADCNRVVALPLRQGEVVIGGVALGLKQADGAIAQSQLAALALAGERLVAALAQAPEGASDNGRQHSSQEALNLQAAFLAQAELAQAGAVLCNQLAAALRCERVVLGMSEHDEMNVLAVSHGVRPQPGNELARLLGAALQETADQGVRVLYPAPVTDRMRVVLAHAELHARSSLTLASVPLVHQGEVVGALLVERRADAAFSAANLAMLEATAQALAPVLQMRQKAARPWSQRFHAGLKAAMARLRQRDDPLPKLALGVGLAATLAATLIPLPYRIGAPARLEGAVQRVVVAPMDGYLQRTHVRPGDVVAEGDVLLEMADQDLLLEQRKWESALIQHENGYAAALARADRSQFIIAQGKASEARAQLDLVRRQLGRARLVAPIAGVVIKGDLTQALGAPVQRGETLVVLAPQGQFRLIVEVDERDVRHVQAGQRGQVALSALPGEPVPFEVERVTPVARVNEGRNAFEVQARLLDAAAATLRPGLNGVAKIDAGERSAAWMLARRVVEGARSALWNWGW
jgi:biotin carboxyl carrier protein